MTQKMRDDGLSHINGCSTNLRLIKWKGMSQEPLAPVYLFIRVKLLPPIISLFEGTQLEGRFSSLPEALGSIISSMPGSGGVYLERRPLRGGRRNSNRKSSLESTIPNLGDNISCVDRNALPQREQNAALEEHFVLRSK